MDNAENYQQLDKCILYRQAQHIKGVSKRMIRFQIIISNNEDVLQLQNKLQTIQSVLKFHSP